MKRILAVVLCLLMIMSMGGCKSSDRAAPVTEDGKKIVRVLTEPALESYVEAIVKDSEEELAGTHVEVEVLPHEKEERESALSRIRAEIIAGEGPDVFAVSTGTQLVTYDGKYIIGSEDSLFTDVRQSLEQNIFLPLDEYLSGEYLKLDEHFEVLMDSGRSDEGLEVLPLTYKYTVYLMDKSKIDGDHTDFSTLESLKNCTDERLKNFIGLQCSEMVPGYFTDMVDYENGDIKLSFEEFKAQVLELNEISHWNTESYSETEGYPGSTLFYDYFDFREWNDSYDNILPIVMPNIDGGITVDITSIVAVNRNCINKEEAVHFAEMFFYSKSQRVESRCSILGMDTQKNLYASPEDSQVEKFLLDNMDRVSYVRYNARMDDSLKRLINSLYSAGESEVEDLISEAYSELQMIAAE